MRFQAPESLAEQIAQHLGRQIICGQLQPKERIQELKISGELNVSRGSVREALLILQGRHLIEIYPRRGAVVSELTTHNVAGLYDIYQTLLSMLIKKYALMWRDDLKPLSDHLLKINSLIKNEEAPIEEFIDECFQLMTICLSTVQNPFLAETLEDFRPAISRTYYLAMQHRKAELFKSGQFFSDLVSKIQARDMQGIDNAIEVFSTHQKELVITIVEEKFAA